MVKKDVLAVGLIMVAMVSGIESVQSSTRVAEIRQLKQNSDILDKFMYFSNIVSGTLIRDSMAFYK